MPGLINCIQGHRFFNNTRARFIYGIKSFYSTNSKNGTPPETKSDQSHIKKKQNEKKHSFDSQSQVKVTLEAPEEPTTCCMSGCANCVWLEYAEKLTEYYRDGGEQSVKEINEKISDPNIKAYLLHELRMRTKK